MIIRLHKGTPYNKLEKILLAIEEKQLKYITTEDKIFIMSDNYVGDGFLAEFKYIKDIIHLSDPYKLVNKNCISKIDLGNNVSIDQSSFSLIAGPCSIDSEENLEKVAQKLHSLGIKIMRGGAFKPRSSPYSFQGLEARGASILKKISKKYQLKTISEAIDEKSLEIISENCDIIQIGARNMNNYHLLKLAGKQIKPILLKRGFDSTEKELLSSIEYLLNEGNSKIIICLRGIRSHSLGGRFALDFGLLYKLMKEMSFPVIIDPSHAGLKKGVVHKLGLAATAFGCSGLILEIHSDPSKALSDNWQTLNLDEFEVFYKEAMAIRRLK